MAVSLKDGGIIGVEKRKEAFNRAMAELLEIPKDLVLDVPKVTLIGQNELYLENHRGIIEYRTDLLRLNISRGFIEIQGDDLEIKTLMPEELYITGVIHSILFRD